jgi:hypothetical protein
MADSLGDVETLYFAPRQARYLRLASPQRTSDWGVSIFEMEPLDSTLSARISGVDATQAAALWQGGGTVAMPAGQMDPIRSRSRCRGPINGWPGGRLGRWRAAPPDCRCRMHRAVGRTSHTMHRRPAIDKAGWPPLQHNRYVHSA